MGSRDWGVGLVGWMVEESELQDEPKHAWPQTLHPKQGGCNSTHWIADSAVRCTVPGGPAQVERSLAYNKTPCP